MLRLETDALPTRVLSTIYAIGDIAQATGRKLWNRGQLLLYMYR